MNIARSRSISRSKNLPFPKDIFLLGEFKSLVNSLVTRLGIAKRFKPRLYSYADFVFVKFYALITSTPIERASERLNNWLVLQYFNKYKLKPKNFQDGVRKRRLVPHQTDVDKFFRLLSEKEVNMLFGNLLMNVVLKVKARCIGGSKLRFLVDNTEYAYYGKPNSLFEIGTNRKPGTRFCRMFQGHALHGSGMTLFTDFYLLQKGKYRCLNIPHSVEWIRWSGINLSYSLMDREFYRAALIKDLKTCKLPVLIPAKKYPGIKRKIKDFLLGIGPLVSVYHFSQTQKVKPWPSSVHVNFVVIGHKNVLATEIRRQFRQGILTFDEAIKQLAGFFTTLKPWKNHSRWAKWLSRAYKKRWNEETGFSKLNDIHKSFRNHYPNVQLSQLYMRAIIYNNWQYFKREAEKSGIRASKRSLAVFLETLEWRIYNLIEQSVSYNLKYLQKKRRRLYFES
ncbi:transposase [Promethearchaeum syntrophicum]|uniref:Transposase n=1 Tax=Promethearchaeum syntrophicum TaxID=2594042 RepID=A0A5B9D9W8_9ARCH